MMKTNGQWELLSTKDITDSNGTTSTYRMKVFGGWLVKTEVVTDSGSFDGGCAASIHQIFVADHVHEWLVETDFIEEV